MDGAECIAERGVGAARSAAGGGGASPLPVTASSVPRAEASRRRHGKSGSSGAARESSARLSGSSTSSRVIVASAATGRTSRAPSRRPIGTWSGWSAIFTATPGRRTSPWGGGGSRPRRGRAWPPRPPARSARCRCSAAAGGPRGRGGPSWRPRGGRGGSSGAGCRYGPSPILSSWRYGCLLGLVPARQEDAGRRSGHAEEVVGDGRPERLGRLRGLGPSRRDALGRRPRRPSSRWRRRGRSRRGPARSGPWSRP